MPNDLHLPAPLAFVLTGGTARASAQVGMLESLTTHGVTPDLVVASSTGSINAATFCSDPSFGTETLTAMWSTLANDKTLSSTWRKAVRSVTSSQFNKTGDLLRKYVQGAVGHAQFDELEIPLHIVATDLESGSAVRLTRGSVVDAVVASCAFPAIIPPVSIDDHLLIDGSVATDAPIRQAIEAGAKSVIVLDSAASHITEETATAAGWISVMGYSLGHMVRGLAASELVDTASEIPILVISSTAGAPLNIKESPHNIEVGQQAANTVIAAHRARRWRRPLKPGVYGAPHGYAADPRIARLMH